MVGEGSLGRKSTSNPSEVQAGTERGGLLEVAMAAGTLKLANATGASCVGACILRSPDSVWTGGF